MHLFQPRDRDAYPAIRGYVYQIDLTVGRWLALRGGQVLELERGEDIDRVGQLISAPPGEAIETRLLEQVKHRDLSVTLRTPAALEAVANFHDHRAKNPDIDLWFCFVTNAAVGRERLSSFPGNAAGITLWEQVRTGQLVGPDAVEAAERLRAFLAAQSRPDGLDDGVWTAWTAYLAAATAVEFGGFVARFEWSTSQPAAAQLPTVLRSAVRAHGIADTTTADAVIDRLFVHVARLLSTPGMKRLAPADLGRLLAAPTLPDADRDRLAHLRAAVAAHGDRLDQLETHISALGSRVEAMFLSGGERVQLAIPVPDLTPQLPAARLSPRTQTVTELAGAVERFGWSALHGGPDVGKSQLAVQLAARMGCRGWVRFHRDLAPAGAGQVLDAALAALAGWNGPPRRAGWYAEALASANGCGILVLDDLPRIPADSPFVERLIEFGSAARAARIGVLSTSQFVLPARLRRTLGGDRLDDRPAPPFTTDEAADLFRAFGAPVPFLSGQRLHFLNVQASGHPLLLAATAEFLAARGWRYQEDEVEALLRGDHTHDVLPDVIDRLARTLGDPPRELLYRLTLPDGPFGDAEVAALARVSPPVERPRERLNELLGAWVQRDSGTRMTASPLVRPLGPGELRPEVAAGCYRALAEVIALGRTMNPPECARAIRYNLRAGDGGRAVTLYVILLIELQKEGRVEHIVPYIDRWRAERLPAGLSVGTQLFVRAYQLAAFTEYGLDLQFLLEDIDDLLAEAGGDDGWGIAAVAGRNLGLFRERHPDRAIKYVRRAAQLPAVRGPDGSEIELEGFNLPEMLWTLVIDLRTPGLIGQWLDAVASLPEHAREVFWGSDLAQRGVWLVANKVYAVEWEKPKAEQDWDGLFRALGGLLDRARALGQARLEAALAVAMIDILGDRKRLAEIEAVAQPTLSRWAADPDVQFRVRGAWGRQFAHEKRPAEALALLDAALAQPQAADDHQRLRCLLAANICVPPGDLRYAERARTLARESADAPAIEASRALGEYALSAFRAVDGRSGAIAVYPAWAEAVRRFLAVPSKDKIWRDLFVSFAHTTNYLSQLAREGVPPDSAFDGSPYVVPTRGFLMKDYMPEREALYLESGAARVSLLMGAYAAAAGAGEDATAWMSAAVEEARRTGSSYILTAAGGDAAAQLLAAGRFEDAVETGVSANRGMVVHHALKTAASQNPDGDGVDLIAEFRRLGEEQRRMADCFGLIGTLIPAGLALVRLSLTDPGAAASAGRRVAALCRGLAGDEWGDRELWSLAAGLVEASSVEGANANRIVALTDPIEGDSERAVAIRLLAHVLATWHASPEEAIRCQLGMIELLLRWFKPGGSVHRLLLMPYIAAFWRYNARERRFAFRAPDLVIAAVESAAAEPEADRIAAVLSAAANGFRLKGAHQILQRLRAAPVPPA